MARHGCSFSTKWLFGLLLAASAFPASTTSASDSGSEPDLLISRVLRLEGTGVDASARAPMALQNVAANIVWVGHSALGPGGAFRGVGVNGLWDFGASLLSESYRIVYFDRVSGLDDAAHGNRNRVVLLGP